MINLVEQIENRYMAQLENDSERELYMRIPQKIRQGIMIRKLNCKPYGRRKTMIRWGSPELKSIGFVCMGNMTEHTLELTVLPTPAQNDPDAAWYTKEGLQEVVNNPEVLKKLVIYKKNDGSRMRMRFKHLTWDEAAEVIQPIVLWTRKHQNEVRLATTKPKGNTVGVNEFEMLALVMRKFDGGASVDKIAEGYANLFGFNLTNDIVDGVTVALSQHSSDSDQFIGGKDMFKMLPDGTWALR
ncbi:MAG: hypothetical protein IJS09_03655 [Treponema sp.]|nr:hypothetical protein [Treponema sp.]